MLGEAEIGFSSGRLSPSPLCRQGHHNHHLSFSPNQVLSQFHALRSAGSDFQTAAVTIGRGPNDVGGMITSPCGAAAPIGWPDPYSPSARSTRASPRFEPPCYRVFPAASPNTRARPWSSRPLTARLPLAQLDIAGPPVTKTARPAVGLIKGAAPRDASDLRRAFARIVQDHISQRRALLPPSVAITPERGDLRAYGAPAFPATLAYIQAMGTLLHKIIHIACRPPRPEKQFRFDAVTVPQVPIADYLERLRCFFLCSPECFVLAMIYIDRLVRLYDGKVVLSSLNIHRILVTAVMIAAKFFDDVYYSNSFYAKIGGLSLEEMNVLESHFLHLIKYDLYVSPREYERYRRNVSLLHASCQPRMDVSTPSTSSPAISRGPQGKLLTYVATN
eukprot:Protomagalhaensia_sp_Gyna_25__2586@NODE_246_length_4207_cov_20_933781_g189_i0_p1_GENE_NODE_246_length_4207_cov_20_933781_g189_i0NODE_246_length_4207_cov_20_933781_g189_i0_p1_ORF_typecomplete_len390_score7_10Cyclin/PF08613_11/5_9e35Cyclin_N/PF00134_23/7_8e08_NODE_246_length_4207_cov_20_933781_g189_i028314000